MPIVNGLFYSGGGEPTTGLAADLLLGKTLNNEDGDSVVGTMPNNGAVGGTITQQAGKVIIPAGYTSGGQVEANMSGLVAGNVKQGAIIGGVAGTFPSDGDADVGNVLAGKTFYAGNATRKTGSMVNHGTITQTISTQGGQYTVPAGYHNGSGKVTASFVNLIAANIKSGVNIGGVIGTLEPCTTRFAIFTTNGSLVVPQGVTAMHILAYAAGNNGSNGVVGGGAGGTRGAYVDSIFNVTPGGTINITVGTGNTVINGAGLNITLVKGNGGTGNSMNALAGSTGAGGSYNGGFGGAGGYGGGGGGGGTGGNHGGSSNGGPGTAGGAGGTGLGGAGGGGGGGGGGGSDDKNNGAGAAGGAGVGSGPYYSGNGGAGSSNSTGGSGGTGFGGSGGTGGARVNQGGGGGGGGGAAAAGGAGGSSTFSGGAGGGGGGGYGAGGGGGGYGAGGVGTGGTGGPGIVLFDW